MQQINCYIPIKVCITGRLSDAQLEQLGQTLTRTITARMEQARHTLGEHGYAPAGESVASAREHVDQARLSDGYYGLPSYDNVGEVVRVPVISGTQAQLEEMLRSALDYWEEQSKELPSADERARARRVFILLGFGPENSFKNGDDVDRFIDLCIKTADDEDDTLKAAEQQLTDKLDDLLFDEGAVFPNTWAWRVRREFYTSADLSALERTIESARSDVLGRAAYLSDDVWDRGLQLSLNEASTLSLSNLVGRALNSERAKETSTDPLIHYTQALLRFARATAHYWLVHGYKVTLDNRIERICKGDLVVGKGEYESLKGAYKVFRFKLEAFEIAASSSNLSKAINALLLWDPGPATFNRLYFVGWPEEGVQAFWKAIAKVDARIAGTGFNECIWRAAVWATERGYYSKAGREVWEAIKDNWPKMIAMMVAIIIGVGGAQAIPGVNIAVDIALVILFGLDVAQAVLDLGGALKAAGSAKSVVEMEHASARLARTLVGKAAEIALWAATWGTVKAAKALAELRKAEKLVKTYGDSATRDALRKAKGNVEEAEKILTKKREYERQERELQQAEQRRKAAEAERQRKLEEGAAPKRKQQQEAEAETQRKQEKEERPGEKEEAEARQMVTAEKPAKRRQAKAKDKEPLEGGKGKPRQGVKPGEERDFRAEYEGAQEAARQARNEVLLLEQELKGLQRQGPFPGRGERLEDLSDRLTGARKQKNIDEAAIPKAEKALRESTLPLHEKLSAVARNRKEVHDIRRLAKGEDKVGKFRADLTNDQIKALAKDPIEIDHIVSIRRITVDPKFRGFEKLGWEDQLEIVNLRDNLVAMKASLNASKGQIPWRDWHQTARKFYDSQVVDDMIRQEARIEQLIVDKIAEKL